MPLRHFPVSLVFLFSVPAPVLAQRAVDISYVQEANGRFVFTAVNHAYCPYVVKVNFSVLTNLRSDGPLPYIAEVKPGTNKLFTLSTVNAAEPVALNFSRQFYKGCLAPKPDTAFAYRLPYAAGKTPQRYEMKSPEEGGWYILRFKMTAGDTIFAARGGIVSETDVSHGENDTGGTGPENYVEVAQADCTFGHYGVVKKDGALVHPGQTVKAGDPLALVGGDSFGRGSDIRFSVECITGIFTPEGESKTATKWIRPHTGGTGLEKPRPKSKAKIKK